MFFSLSENGILILVMFMEKLLIGSHVSFNKDEQLLGSTKEALSYGSTTFMFYTGAPQNTNRALLSSELTSEAQKLMRENNIDINDVIIHAPYIINLANKNSNFEFAIRFLKEEIKRAESLNISKIVLHPGSHVGIGYEEGIKNIIDGLNQVIDENQKTIICLETMAGKGTECGITFEQIKKIIDGIHLKDKIGVCLDTCHIHDAGYDLLDFDKVLDDFDKIIGLSYLKCVHINDSKNIKGSHKDRHENFGYGFIGFDNLMKIVYHDKLKKIPKILETPYVTANDNSKERLYPPYKHEIQMIKDKQFNAHLIDNIRNDYK